MVSLKYLEMMYHYSCSLCLLLATVLLSLFNKFLLVQCAHVYVEENATESVGMDTCILIFGTLNSEFMRKYYILHLLSRTLCFLAIMIYHLLYLLAFSLEY